MRFFLVLTLVFASALDAGAKTNSKKINAQSKLIFIDPGHTPDYPGVIGACGSYEVILNDAVSVKLASELGARGYRVMFSRQPESRLQKTKNFQGGREPREMLLARSEKANQARADLFISLHHDSVPETALVNKKNVCKGFSESNEAQVISDEFLSQPGVQVGFNTFYAELDQATHLNRKSLRLARLIGDEFLKLKRIPSTYHNLKYEPDCNSCKTQDAKRGVISRSLAVLKENKMPSVLIEISNLRIVEHEADAQTEESQTQTAKAIAGAVENYFKN